MVGMSDLVGKDSKDVKESTVALETQLGLFKAHEQHTSEDDVLDTIGCSHSETNEKKDEDSCLSHNERDGLRCIGTFLTQSDLCEIKNQLSVWLSFLSRDMSLELVRKKIRLFKRKIKIVRKNPWLSESRHRRNIYRKLLRENTRCHPRLNTPFRHRRSAAHGELLDRDPSGGFDWRQVLMEDTGACNLDKIMPQCTSANETVFSIASTTSDTNNAESCKHECIDNKKFPLWFVNMFRNNDALDLKMVQLDHKEATASDEIEQLMYRTIITVCSISHIKTVSNPFGLLIMEKVDLDEANTKKTDQSKSSQGHPIDTSSSLSTGKSHIDSGTLLHSRKKISEKSKRHDNTEMMFLERLCMGTTRKRKSSTVEPIDEDQGASNERTISGNGDVKQKECISMYRNSFLVNIREWIRSKLKVLGQCDIQDGGKRHCHCETGQFGSKANSTKATSHRQRLCLPKQQNGPGTDRVETGGFARCQNLLNKNTNANVKSDELQDGSTEREPPAELNEEISRENVPSENIQQRQIANDRPCRSTYVEFANNALYIAQGHKFVPHTKQYDFVSTMQFPTNSEKPDADCRIKEHTLEEVNTPCPQANGRRSTCVEEQLFITNRSSVRFQISHKQDVRLAANNLDCPFRQNPLMEAVRSSDALNQQSTFAKENSIDIYVSTDSGLSRRQEDTETGICGWLKPDLSKAVNSATNKINPMLNESRSIDAAGPSTHRPFGESRKVNTLESMLREIVGYGPAMAAKLPTFDEKKMSWANNYIYCKSNQCLQCVNTFRQSMRTFIQEQLGKEDTRNISDGTEKGNCEPRNSMPDGNEAKPLVQYQKRSNEMREDVPDNHQSINAMHNGSAQQLWKDSFKNRCSLSRCHCLVRFKNFETYLKRFRQEIRMLVQEHLNSINVRTDAKQYPSKRLYSGIEGVSLHPLDNNIAGYGFLLQGQKGHVKPYQRHPRHFTGKNNRHTSRDEIHWRLPSKIILSFLNFGLELHGSKITSVLDKELDKNPGQALSDLVVSIQACVDLCENFFIKNRYLPTDVTEIKAMTRSNNLHALDAVSESNDRTTTVPALTLKGIDKDPPLEKEELSKSEINDGSKKARQIHNDSERQATPFGVINKYQFSQIQHQRKVMNVKQKTYHAVLNRSPQFDAVGAFFREKPFLHHETEAEIITAKCTADPQLTLPHRAAENIARTSVSVGDHDEVGRLTFCSRSLPSLVKNKHMPTCNKDLDEPFCHDSPNCCYSDPTPFLSKKLTARGYRICGNRLSVLASACCKQSKNRSCNYPSSPRNVTASHLGNRLQHRPRTSFEGGRRTSFNARRHDRINSSSRRRHQLADSQSNTSVHCQCENGQCQWIPKRETVSRQSRAENQRISRVLQAPCKSCNPSTMQECNTCDIKAMEASESSADSVASNYSEELLSDLEIQEQSQKKENPRSSAPVSKTSLAIGTGRYVSAMSKIQRGSQSESIENSPITSKRPSESELNELSRGPSEYQMAGSKTPLSRKQSLIQSNLSIYPTSQGPSEYQILESKSPPTYKQMVESEFPPSRKQSGIRSPFEYQITGSKTPPSSKQTRIKRNVTTSRSSRGPSDYEMAGSKTPLSRKQSRIQSNMSIYSISRGPSEYQMAGSKTTLSRKQSEVQGNRSIYSSSRGPSEYQIVESKTPPSHKQSRIQRNESIYSPSGGPSEFQMEESKTPPSHKQSRIKSSRSLYSSSRGPSEYQTVESEYPPSGQQSRIKSNKSIYSPGPVSSEYKMTGSKTPLSRSQSGMKRNLTMSPSMRGPSDQEMAGSKTPLSGRPSRIQSNLSIYSSSPGPSEYQMAWSKTSVSRRQSKTRSNASSRGRSKHLKVKPVSRTISFPSKYSTKNHNTPPNESPSEIQREATQPASMSRHKQPEHQSEAFVWLSSDESFDYESGDATPLRSTTALPPSTRPPDKDKREMTVCRHKQMPSGIQREASPIQSSKQHCKRQREMPSRNEPQSAKNSSDHQSKRSIPQSRHRTSRAKRTSSTSMTNRDPPMYQQEESVSPPSYKSPGFTRKGTTPQSSNRSSKYLNGALISPPSNMPLEYETRAHTFRTSRRSIEYQGKSPARQYGCQKIESKLSPQQRPSRYKKEPRNSRVGSMPPPRQSRYERETPMSPSDKRKKPTSSAKQKSTRYSKEPSPPSRSGSQRVSLEGRLPSTRQKPARYGKATSMPPSDGLECDCQKKKLIRFQEEKSSHFESGSPRNSKTASYLAKRRPTGYFTETPSSDELPESQEDLLSPPRQTNRQSRSTRFSTQSKKTFPKKRKDPSEFLGIPATSPKLISSSDEELTELRKVSPSSVSGTGERTIKKKQQISLMDQVGPEETSVSCVDDELGYPEGCCLRESTLSHRLKREKSFEYYKKILDQLSNCITASKRIYEDNLDRTLHHYSEKCRELNENLMQMDPEIDEVLTSQAQNDEFTGSPESNSASDNNANPLSWTGRRHQLTDQALETDPDIGKVLNTLWQNEEGLNSPQRKRSIGSYRGSDPNLRPRSYAMNRAGGQCSPQRAQYASLGGRNSFKNEGEMSALEKAFARCGVSDDLKRRMADYYNGRASQADGGSGRNSAFYRTYNNQGNTYDSKTSVLAAGKGDAGGFRRSSSIYDRNQKSTGYSRTGCRIDEICSRYIPMPQTLQKDRQTKRSVIMARYSRQEPDDSRNNNPDYCNVSTNANQGLQSPCLTSCTAELPSPSGNGNNEQLCENEIMENKMQFVDRRQCEIGGSDVKLRPSVSVGHPDSLNRNCNALKHLIVRSSPDTDHSEDHIEIISDFYAASKPLVTSPEQDIRPGLSSPESNSDNKHHNGTLDKAKHLKIFSNVIPENDSRYISTRKERASVLVKKENLETKHPIVTKGKSFWTTHWAMGNIGQTKTFLSSTALDPICNDYNESDTNRSSIGHAILDPNVFKNVEKSSPAVVDKYRHLDEIEDSHFTTKPLKTGELPVNIKETFNIEVSTSESSTLVVNFQELNADNARSNTDISGKCHNGPSKEEDLKKEKAFRFVTSKTNKDSVEIDPRSVLPLEVMTTGQLSVQSSTYGIEDIPLDSDMSDINGIKEVVSSMDIQRYPLDQGKHSKAFQGPTLENSCSTCLAVNFTGSEDSITSSFSSDYSLPSGYTKYVPESKERYERFEHNGSQGLMIEVHLFGSEAWREDGESCVLGNCLAFGDLTSTPHSQRYYAPCNINTWGSENVVRTSCSRALPKKPTRTVVTENETEALRGVNSKPVYPRIEASSAIGMSGHSVKEGRNTSALHHKSDPGGLDNRKKLQAGIKHPCYLDKGDRLGLQDVRTETRVVSLSGTANVTKYSESHVVLEGVHFKKGEDALSSHNFRDSLGKCQLYPLPFRLVLMKVDTNNCVDVSPSQEIRGFYYRKLQGTPLQYVRLAVSGCPVFN